MRQRQAGEVVDLKSQVQLPPGVAGILAGVEITVAAGGMYPASARDVGHDRFRKFPAIDSEAAGFPTFSAIARANHDRLGTALALAPAARGAVRQRWIESIRVVRIAYERHGIILREVHCCGRPGRAGILAEIKRAAG